jgi:hypothetical protein
MNENIKDYSQVFDSEMSLPKSKLEGSDIFFNLAFALYFAATFLSHTTIEAIFGIKLESFIDAIQLVVIVLLFIKVCFNKTTFCQWLLIAVLVAIGFVTWRVSNEGWFFWLVLFVVCGQGIRIKSLAKIVFAETIVLFAYVLVQYNLGNAQDVVTLRSDGTARHTFGISHPNTVGMYLLCLALSFSVLKFGKNPIPDLILLAVFGYINISYLDSRSTLVIYALQGIILLIFYFVKNPTLQKAILFLFFCVALFVLCLSMYFMFFYNSNDVFSSNLNSLFSGRLYLSNAYYEMGGITFLGNDYSAYNIIYWESGKAYNFVVDNAYCHILLRYGIVAFVIFVGAFYSLFFALIKEVRWDALSFALILMSVYAFTETLGIKVECDYFLISIASLVLYKNATKVFNRPSKLPNKISEIEELCGRGQNN